MEEGTAISIGIVALLSIATGTAYYFYVYAPNNQVQCTAGQTVNCKIVPGTTFSSTFSTVSNTTSSSSTTTASHWFCIPYLGCLDALPAAFSVSGVLSLVGVAVYAKPRENR